MDRKLSDENLELLIIKGVLNSKEFITLLMNSFESQFFNNPIYAKMYDVSINHYKDNLTLMDKFIIKDIVDCKDIFDEMEAVDFDMAKNHDFLVKETNQYLKEKSIKQAILDSVGIIDANKNINDIRDKVESALAKDLTMNLGIDYWNTIGARLKQVLLQNENKIPLYYPMLDEFTNGGVIPYSLSLFLSRIHGFKTTLLINLMERESRNGKNVILFSMETSENEIAKRLDSISTLSDINKIHTSKENIMDLAKKLNKRKSEKGLIIIKEFPTGQASTADFRTVLREYGYRGIHFDIGFCDYLTIMQSEHLNLGNLYQDGKKISEELRSLSLEFLLPMISVSQLNREGIAIDFKEVDYTHIGESLGIAASADFMAIMGQDEEKLIYESEIMYKIVKNRLGGRVNEMGKFYVDKKSLKMYDESELEMWLNDANSTKDDRNVSKKY